MYFLHAINSDRQTRLLNVLGQIAMILGDKKNLSQCHKSSLCDNHLRFRACFLYTLLWSGPGQLSRHSYWTRAGQSGDRIPVEARFSAPVQTGPGAQSASCAMGIRFHLGSKRPGSGVPTHRYLAPRLKKEQRQTSSPLCLHGALLGDINFTFTHPKIFMQAVKAEWLLHVTHPWLVNFPTGIIYV